MEKYHEPLPRDEANTIEKAIQKIRFEKVEHLYIFRNQIQIRRFRGTESNVIIENKYLIEFKDSVVIHNHPQGTSFSLEDFYAIVKSDSKMLILVTPFYKYIVKRPLNGWNIQFGERFDELLNTSRLMANDFLNKEISKNEINNFDKEIEKMHYIWSIIFKFYEIDYRKNRL